MSGLKKVEATYRGIPVTVVKKQTDKLWLVEDENGNPDLAMAFELENPKEVNNADE